MSGLVCFKKINDSWKNSNGTFEVLFCGIYDGYIDRKKTPKFDEHIYLCIGLALGEMWPERYPQQTGRADHFMNTNDYPLSEMRELSRAADAFVADFVAGRADPKLGWNEDWKTRLDQSYTEFVRLLRAEVSAREAVEVN